MLQFFNKMLELKHDKKGVTALEYGLIAALIAVAVITAVSTLGNNITATFNTVATKIGTNK